MAKRINQLDETRTIANDNVFAIDSATATGQTNKITFANLKNALDGASTAIRIIKSWYSDDGSGWYRVWSDGWCELGGYTCKSDFTFNRNVVQISVYLCKVSLFIPYISSKYYAFVAAESKFNTGGGNCGYDYIVTNSKTPDSFKTIMCAFNATGSHNNHYSTLYWEAKGKVDLSKLG